MNLFYFFQKYLDKLNDVEFKIKWERFVHNKIKRFMAFVIFIWLLGSIGVGYLSIILVGIVLGFFLMVLFSIYYGYVLFVQAINFLAVNNTRYIQGKVNIEESVIDYDNVVG